MAVISKHRDGDIVLFERHDSPYIFCRLRFPEGGWETRSSKCKRTADALSVAEKWHDEIMFLHGRGLSPKRRTFSFVCDAYLKDLDEEIQLGIRNERLRKDYSAIINRYLKPYFGRKYTDSKALHLWCGAFCFWSLMQPLWVLPCGLSSNCGKH